MRRTIGCVAALEVVRRSDVDAEREVRSDREETVVKAMTSLPHQLEAVVSQRLVACTPNTAALKTASQIARSF